MMRVISPADVATIAVEGRHIRVSGELDLLTEPDFHDALGTFGRSGQSATIVDLSDVTFLDCSGLRPLMRARLALGDRLLLLAPSAQVLRVLDLLVLRELFHVVPESMKPAAPHQPSTGTSATGRTAEGAGG